MGGPADEAQHLNAKGRSIFLECVAGFAIPRTKMSKLIYPGTDEEVDATGVTFPIKAVCEVGEAGKACDGSTTPTGCYGTVEFTQVDAENIEIEWKVSGLKPGLHGFHIHEKAFLMSTFQEPIHFLCENPTIGL